MEIKNLTNELMIDDMEKSIKFYQRILGFAPFVLVPEKDPFFAIMKKNSIQIMLYRRDKFAEEISKLKNIKLGGSVVFYLDIDDVEKFFKDVKDHVKIIKKMHDTDYGTREFSFEDFNGYIWMLSEKKT